MESMESMESMEGMESLERGEPGETEGDPCRASADEKAARCEKDSDR
jgi:hypothetical protein